MSRASLMIKENVDSESFGTRKEFKEFRNADIFLVFMPETPIFKDILVDRNEPGKRIAHVYEGAPDG